MSLALPDATVCHTASHHTHRLEDFCGVRAHDTVRTLLGNAGVAFNDSVVAAAAATINTTKCQTARWQV